MEEIWKEHKDYPNYLFSTLGNVISLWKGYNLLMKLSTNSRGYVSLSLKRKDGKQSAVNIHRIIAELFIPNPDGHPVVNHKDGNKANNCISNLEWCTQQDNVVHGYKREYELMSPEGYAFFTENLAQFCKEHSLTQTSMSLVVRGKQSQHKGWTLA